MTAPPLPGVSVRSPAAESPRVRRVGRVLAIAMVSTAWTAVLAGLVLAAREGFEPPIRGDFGGPINLAGTALIGISYSTLGALLAGLRPRNPIGWLLGWVGLSMAVLMPLEYLVAGAFEVLRPVDRGLQLLAWFASSFNLPTLTVVVTFVALLFPTGRLVDRRWRWVGMAAVAGGVLVGLGVALDPEGLLWFPALANPMAAPADSRPFLTLAIGAGIVLAVGAFGLAATSLVVRYRTGEPITRLQIRWVALAMGLLTSAVVPFFVARYLAPPATGDGGLLVGALSVAGALLPAATAIAILRHRLLDIDLIIGRTLVYVPLTGLLAGVYAALVALLQRAFVALTGDVSDAAIIITTLFLASVFTPLRKWLEGVVDRHFSPAAARAVAGATPAVGATVAAAEGAAGVTQGAAGVTQGAAGVTEGADDLAHLRDRLAALEARLADLEREEPRRYSIHE